MLKHKALPFQIDQRGIREHGQEVLDLVDFGQSSGWGELKAIVRIGTCCHTPELSYVLEGEIHWLVASGNRATLSTATE